MAPAGTTAMGAAQRRESFQWAASEMALECRLTLSLFLRVTSWREGIFCLKQEQYNYICNVRVPHRCREMQVEKERS